MAPLPHQEHRKKWEKKIRNTQHKFYDSLQNGGFPGCNSGKEPLANVGDIKDRFSPWVGKIPWRRVW